MLLAGVITGTAVLMTGCTTNPHPIQTSAATESTTAEEIAQNEGTSAATEDNESEAETEGTEAGPKTVMVNYEDVLNANNSGSILKNHENYSTNVKVIRGDYRDYSSLLGYSARTIYGTSDYAFYMTDFTGVNPDNIQEEKVLYTHTDEFDEISYIDGTSEAFRMWYAMPGSEKAWNIPDIGNIPYMIDVNGEFVGTEQEATDNNDGTITMVTTAPAQGNSEFLEMPADWNDGTIEYTYILDADTLELQKLNTKVIFPEGEFAIYEITSEYDVAAPQEFTDMCDFAAKYDVKPKHVTVIYDPDTNMEERYEMQTESSNLVKIAPKEGYALYMDKEGTIPFEKPEENEYTIYGLPITDVTDAYSSDHTTNTFEIKIPEEEFEGSGESEATLN